MIIEESMNKFRLSIPIVFTIFNRPEKTRRVFESIRQAEPPQLLVIADGPRQNFPSDNNNCALVRSVVDHIDWDCNVLTNFADNNLGCRQRISTGLDWVFDIVEEAIILEDDCLPHPTFYRFCEELLHKYRDDERVMVISGNNFQNKMDHLQSSYYFSRYPHVWGWATWRRSWRLNTPKMEYWPQFRNGGWLDDIFTNRRDIDYWTKIFNMMYAGEIDSWAYAWTFACWIQSGLTILPNVNLVTNIGFGDDSTHTTKSNRFSNMPVHQMNFPMEHPSFVLRKVSADSFTQRYHYDRESWIFRLKRRVKQMFK
jgi:hypothetical protein